MIARFILPCLIAVNLAPIAVAEAPWMLLGREGDCASLDILVRREGLSHVPASPEEFAAMLRPRYPDLTIGLPEGFPADMAGRAVMVRWTTSRAPIFVRADMCR